MNFLHFILIVALLAATFEAIPIGLQYTGSYNPFQFTAVDQFTSGSILEATGNRNFWASRRYF